MDYGWDELTEILENIYYELDLYQNYVSQNLERYTVKLYRMLSEEKEQIKIAVSEKLLEKVRNDNYYISIYLYSVAVSLTKRACYLEELEQYIISCKELGASTKYFLFNQMKALLFSCESLNTFSSRRLQWKLLKDIVGMFEEKFEEELVEIPVESRNEKMVLMLTEQFLSFQHGPTKTASDRCKTIIKQLGKNVMLVNTAELLSPVGEVAFFGAVYGNYDASLNNRAEIIWEETAIPYFQCEKNMPDFNTIQMLLQMIREIKPLFIVNIGGGSILGNLANKIVPVLAVGCVPSELECTFAKYQTISKKLNEEEMGLLASVGRTEQNIIQAVFTSGLKTQESHISRDMIGIAEDKFVVVVVGARLNVELTDEFMDMLEAIINDRLCVVCLGAFDKELSMLEKHPKLKGKFRSLGFVDDILAYMECCDLYLNPKRKGGGTSCVEAMSVGVPVITVDYGDVAVNVGSEFCVENYREMGELLLKYQGNSEFYKQQSEKARNRAEMLLNTDTEFLKVIEEVGSREELPMLGKWRVSNNG